MSEKHALERREKHFSISSIRSKLIPHREAFDHLQLTTAILLKESWISPSASNKLLQAVKGTSEKITDNKANAADYASAHLLFSFNYELVTDNNSRFYNRTRYHLKYTQIETSKCFPIKFTSVLTKDMSQ